MEFAGRKSKPEHFAHLIKEGKVTLLGFGSLVNEISARSSFPFTNFRLASVRGYRRIFNRSDWVNMIWGDTRFSTGEVCALAMARTGEEDLISRIAVMDVDESGLDGFLRRESTYEIFEVPFLDDYGVSGVALACGECSDEDMVTLWGADCWYLTNRVGRISYMSEPAEAPEADAGGGESEGSSGYQLGSSTKMPLVPEVHEDGGVITPGDPAVFLPMCGPVKARPVILPVRKWVYPGPGYLRMVYRAHLKAGIADNLLDTCWLQDRKTTVGEYLDANPLLKDWVMDPDLYDDRPCDRFG